MKHEKKPDPVVEDIKRQVLSSIRKSLENYRRQGIEPTLSQWLENAERELN